MTLDDLDDGPLLDTDHDDAPFGEPPDVDVHGATQPPTVAALSAELATSLTHVEAQAVNVFHWSDVKWLAKSAKHYAANLNEPIAPTRGMRRGTIVHRAILGGPALEIFDGKSRRGAAWDAFAARSRCPREIVLTSEVEEAEPYIDAVRCDPVAREYLAGVETEVPLSWTVGSRRCSTRGVDILRRGVRHGDLKTVQSCRPEELKWIVRKFLYHAQLEWIAQGLAATGHAFTHPPFLLCVEGPPAYDVVVVELTPKDLLAGAKMIHSWWERLDQAESSGEWTGYATAPVRLELGDGYEIEEDEDDETSEEAA